MSEDITELLGSADRELEAGRYTEAFDFAKRVLEVEPQNMVALQGLASLAYQLEKWDEAADYSFQACLLDPSDANFAVLIVVSRIKKNYKASRNYFLKILELYPDNVSALSGLADLYERAGYRQLAIAYSEAAVLGSKSVDRFLQYGKLFAFHQSGHLLDVLKQIRPPDTASPEEMLQYEMELVIRTEHAERASRGLGRMASSVDDLFFNFARPQRDAVEALTDRMLAAHPGTLFLHYAKASCLIARGKHKESQAHFEYLTEKKPNHQHASVSFNDAFYLGLEEQDENAVFNALPKFFDIQTAAFTDDPIILLCCDYSYFENFCRPLLSSIDRFSPKAQVQVHVMNPPSNGGRDILNFCKRLTTLKVAISTEQTPTPTREYFHSIRFVRLRQFLQRYRKPIFLLDVDALIRRDINPVLKSFSDDIALMAHSGLWAPWNQFRAGIVGFNPTQSGFGFSKLVALYIMSFHISGTLRWGIDQIALYGVHTFLKAQGRAPAITFYEESLMTDNCNDEAIMWIKSGNSKFEQPTVLEHESIPHDSPRVKYTKALEELGYVYAD